VRSTVLLGRARQHQRPRARERRELRERGGDHAHVQLVLEVRGRRADLARELEHAARLAQVAGQRLLGDQPAQPCAAVAHRCRDLDQRVDARVVRTEQRQHVAVRGELAHRVEDARRSQPGFTRPLRELGRRARRIQAVHLDAAHLAQRAQLEAADEPAADQAVAQ
jgi:hypothetical protein